MQEIIYEFKDEQPMYSSIEIKEEKDQLYFKYDEENKKYTIYEVDFKKIIYKNFEGEEIYTICGEPTRQKQNNKYTNMFINNHKRAIGFGVGGLGLLAYLVIFLE